jgi:hypothetical protein
MALLRMGMLNSDPAIGKAMRFLGNCYTANKRPNWEDEPWETSWAILAICESGSSELMDEACDGMRWLMNMQDQRGALVAPHYTAYYVKIVEVLCKKQACRGYCLLNEKEIKETAKKGAAHLMTIVEGEQLWTGEPWSNGQILWALCSSGQFPVEDAASVEMVLDWFQAAQEPKGNWGDAEDTACAIIGLLALLKQRMMDRSEERLKVEDADTIVYNHLRRLYEPPRPCPERKLVQVQEDGTTTINLSSRTLKVAAILFGLASGFTVVLALWEYFKSYLGFG